MMRDEFYIVLPSNSSMKFYPDNTTTHYTTHLPQSVSLHGSWAVSLVEMHIPMTILHVPPEGEQNFINIITSTAKPMAATNLLDHDLRKDRAYVPPFHRSINALIEVINEAIPTTATNLLDHDLREDRAYVPPGLYRSINSLIEAINEIPCVIGHFRFHCDRNGYVSVTRICTECKNMEHSLYFSGLLNKILGFTPPDRIILQTGDKHTGRRPANLIGGIPSMLFVYTDICEPYITGDVHTPLLRVVASEVSDNYSYGSMKIQRFSPPRYLPLLRTSFQTITIDIRDEFGEPIPFEHGTLTVTLQFKRID